MGSVQIRDTSLWTKHIEGDPELRRRLESLPAEAKVWLRVDGKRGCFQKMKSGPHGPMQGLKPLDEAREHWRELYPKKAGQRVELKLEDELSAPVPVPAAPERSAASEAERDAAWSAFKELARAGWRSEIARGDRDELHER